VTRIRVLVGPADREPLIVPGEAIGEERRVICPVSAACGVIVRSGRSGARPAPLAVPRPRRPAWTRRLSACRFDLRHGHVGVGRCTPDRGFGTRWSARPSRPAPAGLA